VADIARGYRVQGNCVVPNWIGLPRTVDELAAMPAAPREAAPPLVPPTQVASAVMDLIVDDSLNGRVAVLEGGQPRQLLDGGT
jgi:hypothetical protein